MRLRYEIRKQKDGTWGFFAKGEKQALDYSFNKGIIVKEAAHQLQEAWDRLRVRSELSIKSVAGRIRDKRTYGDDPRKTRG